ncbi:putative nuclease HARBI1 [Hyperolius riggenbachi]|uniref:putative nuclease HARBI1 n=1 Tax=Hyperolius riggenbachi TaxID=752182 RepID=UPI0035A35CE4
MTIVSARQLRASLALLLLLKVRRNLRLLRQRRRRRQWSKTWLQDRDVNSHDSLLRELSVSSPNDLTNYLRMPEAAFQYVLDAVTPLIAKEDTWMRKSISPRQRLTATLRFLATGRSLQDLKFTTGISPQALGFIIPETCQAIIDALKNDYMKFPETPQDWLDVAAQFEDVWDFPNCGGALDGKHIRITPPANTGSFYFNYKGYFSIILMALVNANYEFLFVDIGRNGRMSDGGVIERTTFFHKLRSNQLNLPDNASTKNHLNFVFVADEAFPLQPHLLKPFPAKNIQYRQAIFNYRLSRARMLVENAFGILASRFRILHTAINLRVDKIDKVVYACCVLHNFLRQQYGATYLPVQAVDRVDVSTGQVVEGEWRSNPQVLTDLQPCPPRNATTEAKQNRDAYVAYFNSQAGSVAWQHDAIV